MAVLLEADSPSTNRWAEVERSDVVANNLNPDFPKPLVCSYNFEKLQPMKLVVYDVDAGTTDPAAVKLADSDFLGAAPQPLPPANHHQQQQAVVRMHPEQRKDQWQQHVAGTTYPLTLPPTLRTACLLHMQPRASFFCPTCSRRRGRP